MPKRKTLEQLVDPVSHEFHDRHEEFASQQVKKKHNNNSNNNNNTNSDYDDSLFMATEFPAIGNIPDLAPNTTYTENKESIENSEDIEDAQDESPSESVAIAAAAMEKQSNNTNQDNNNNDLNNNNNNPQNGHDETKTPHKHFEYHIPSTQPPSPIKSLENRYYNNVLPMRSPQKRQIHQHLQDQANQVGSYPSYFHDLCDVGKQQLFDKLAGRQLINLVGLDDEFQNVYSLLERTVVHGEGNSCLIIGPRATGKTLLLENALQKLSKSYDREFITLRLSGFSLNDDKMAVREMCRQLDNALTRKLNIAKYESIEKKSISESLISLLSVIDSSVYDQNENENDEQDEEEDEEDADLAPVNKPSRSSVAVVIILEEVDRFAQHGKQILLYNLLDLAQASTTPLAIVGLSPRTNTRELFEKRVRSRFSQRIVVTKRAQTVDEFWKLARSGIMLDEDEFKRPANALNNIYTDEQYETYRQAWNNSIESCFQNKQSNLYNLLEYVFYTTKDVREFYNRLLFSISLANPVFSDFEVALLEKEQGGNADTQSYIQCLSELELSLLICAARVEIKYSNDTFNFNVVYDEYVKMAKQLHKERMATLTSVDSVSVGYRIWSRDVARSAWEKLESMDLITYVEAGANGTGVLVTVEESSANAGGPGRKRAKPAGNGTGANGGELTTIYAKPTVGSTKGAAVSDDIRMVKVDASLQEIASMLGNEHVLSQWTRL